MVAKNTLPQHFQPDGQLCEAIPKADDKVTITQGAVSWTMPSTPVYQQPHRPRGNRDPVTGEKILTEAEKAEAAALKKAADEAAAALVVKAEKAAKKEAADREYKAELCHGGTLARDGCKDCGDRLYMAATGREGEKPPASYETWRFEHTKTGVAWAKERMLDHMQDRHVGVLDEGWQEPSGELTKEAELPRRLGDLTISEAARKVARRPAARALNPLAFIYAVMSGLYMAVWAVQPTAAHAITAVLWGSLFLTVMIARKVARRRQHAELERRK